MLSALCILLAGQTVSEPQVSMGELRKSVPAALRPTKVAPNPGWSLALKASGARPTPNTIGGIISQGAKLAEKDLSRRARNVPSEMATPEDNVRGLLTAWRKEAVPDLLPRSKRVLARNKSRMATMRAALKYPVWAQPGYPDSLIPKQGDLPEMLFPEFAGMKELTFAFILQAYVNLAEHHTEAAGRDLDDAWSIGDHAMGGSIIGYMVGTAETSAVYANVFNMAKRGQLSDSILKRFAQRLATADVRARLVKSLRPEFDSFAVWSIAAMPDPSKEVLKADADAQSLVLHDHPHPFDRAETVRWCADVYLEAIANLSRPWNAQVDVEEKYKGIYTVLPKLLRSNEDSDDEKPKPSDAEISAARLVVRTISNPLGRTVVEITSVAAHIAESGFLIESRYRSHSIALAILAHKKRTGSLPRSLSELSDQDGLSAVPNDPYSGKPFRYDPGRQVIWGAGPDLKFEDKYAVHLKS